MQAPKVTPLDPGFGAQRDPRQIQYVLFFSKFFFSFKLMKVNSEKKYSVRININRSCNVVTRFSPKG